MLLAHFGRRLGAHLLGEEPAHRLFQHQLFPPGRALGLALLQHRFARGPAEIMPRRHQLIDEPHGARGGGAQHLARQHGGHGIDWPCGLDRAHGAVQSRKDAELHFGKAEPGRLLAVGDAPMAGERKL